MFDHLFHRGSAEYHPLVEKHVIADLGSFSYYHAHPVVHEKAPANLGSGVDLNAREPPSQMRDQASKEVQAVPPQPMSDAMQPDGVKTRVAAQDFPKTPGRWIFGEYCSDVFSNTLNSAHIGSLTSCSWPHRSRPVLRPSNRGLLETSPAAPDSQQWPRAEPVGPRSNQASALESQGPLQQPLP